MQEVVANVANLKPKRERLFRISDQPSPTEDFWSFDGDGTPVVHPHTKQRSVIECGKRFVLALAGVRSGKTSVGPWWIVNEMQDRGPGNYMLVAPTFQLLDKAAVPELRTVLHRVLGLGEVIGGASGEFRVSVEGHRKLWPDVPIGEPTRIIFGYAAKPESLAAVTAKAAWLDECGQVGFKQDSHDEINARLSIHRGRILYSTRPYGFGWLKDDVYDRADRSRQSTGQDVDDDYAVFEYESRDNPRFSQEEWDRQEAIMPPYKFDMMYRGRFSRPAGLIYECIDPDVHFIPTEPVPPEWKRYLGIDFGAPNFAATFLAEETGYHELEGPTHDGNPLYLRTEGGDPAKWNRYIAYAEYRPDVSRTAAEHVVEIKKIWPGTFDYIVGGSMSEGQWRAELKAAGLNIREPDQPEVEIGIDRVYALLREQRLLIMKSCNRLIDEFQTYSRPVDENGNVMEGILDKEMYHSLDSVRYFGSWAGRKSNGLYVGVV